MALAAGTRLGPYEIVGALGEGGMGEVYRARDPKLRREVAIKILPRSFACDPDRLARFDQEAHVLASLNHPHIAVTAVEVGAGATTFAAGTPTPLFQAGQPAAPGQNRYDVTRDGQRFLVSVPSSRRHFSRSPSSSTGQRA